MTAATPAITVNSNYSGGPAIFDSLTIPDVQSVQPSAAVTKIVASAAGMVDTSLIAEQFQEPKVSLRALNIGAILTSCGIAVGQAVSSSALIQYQLRQDGGFFAGAGYNITLSTAKGFLLVESITLKQDDQKGSEIDLTFMPLAVGSNPPLVVNISQNITGTPSVAALFRLGPVNFEGSVLGGVQSVTIKPGMEYKPFRAGGQTGAGVGYIRSRKPTIEIETTAIQIVNSIGFGITGITDGITVGAAQIGYALTADEHVKIGMASGSYEIQDAGYSEEGDAMAKILCTATGTVAVPGLIQTLLTNLA